MGILDGVVQSFKKKIDNIKIKYPIDNKQTFSYVQQTYANLDTAIAIHAVPFLPFSETNIQSEPQFNSLFAGDAEKANEFLIYLSTFDLSSQIVDFLYEKKEFQSKILIDFVHADFLVYKQDEKLLCNIKIKGLVVNYISNAKCCPTDLTLNLLWQEGKFLLYSEINSCNTVMQSRNNQKEISFLTFMDRCVSENNKLLTHQQFIFKYTSIKALERSTQDSITDNLFLKKIFSYLERFEKESKNIVILLPIESLILRHRIAAVIYSFLKYQENNIDNYNFIKSILFFLIENFDFFEEFNKKFNFLVCLNKYIDSTQYDDLCEFDKVYKELPRNDRLTRSGNLLQSSIAGLFRFHKESYIELINELLISFKAKRSVENLAYYSLIKIKINQLSIKDLNNFILFIYQYRLLLENKENNMLKTLSKLYTPLLSKKESSILKDQYFKKFGLNIKEKLEELVLVAKNSCFSGKFFETKPELKQIYEEIKASLAVSAINDINKKILFEIIEKFIICNNITLIALQAIHQWIRLTEEHSDISITTNEQNDPLVFLVTPCAEFSAENDKGTGKLASNIFVDQQTNMSLKVDFTPIETAAKVPLVNKQQIESKSSTSKVLNRDKFYSKRLQSIDSLKKNLSVDEIAQLKEKINEKLHLAFNSLNKKNSLELKVLLADRYYTLSESIKKLLERFLNEINKEVNASAVIFLALEKNMQQIKILNLKQKDFFQQLKINSRAFIVRSDVYIHNQKKFKDQCDSTLAFMGSIFSRIKRGYFYKDITFLKKLTRRIIFLRNDRETLHELFKRELLKLSWFDLLVTYKIMRWPWQKKKTFVARISKYMCCIFYLQKINVLEELQKDLKSRIEFLDSAKTYVSTVENIRTFVLKIKKLSEISLEIENMSKNSSELQKEATEIFNCTEKNLSLGEVIKTVIKKIERLEYMREKTRKNASIYIEQLLEILQSKYKTEASYVRYAIYNKLSSSLSNFSTLNSGIEDCNTEKVRSFNLSI